MSSPIKELVGAAAFFVDGDGHRWDWSGHTWPRRRAFRPPRCRHLPGESADAMLETASWSAG